MTGRARRLRVEHGPRRLGIASSRPRLSWWLPAEATTQFSCRIEAVIDDGAPEVVELAGDRSVLRSWPFAPLRARDRVTWRVQVCTEAGWGDWSDPSTFEVGLLDRDEWDATFIGSADDGDALGARGERPALYFRTRFHVDEEVSRARLRATALGIYELHLDGRRVGDLELTPGFTSYRSALEAQTYDVSDRLTVGEHELVATVTDGWYRGSVGFTRADRSFGERLALLAQVEMTVADGSTEVVAATDERWEASTHGPIRAADLIEGEVVDQRVPFPPVDGWRPVVPVDVDHAVAITASAAPPTRAVETFAAVSVHRLDARRQVVDVGANINGWLRVAEAALGPVGNEVRLTHGERLGDDGDVDLAHLEVVHFTTHENLGHGQVDRVISAGRPVGTFEPRHTTHGFQYARVEGAGDLSPVDVTGVMVHTDLVRTGWFRCSDPMVDRLHDATVLSFRDNACEIPTDCPQRERAGWTGDWQIFAPTASFLYDVAGFTDRWLRDLATDQWPDGRVTNHVPDPVGPRGRESPTASFLTGSSGWGDAAVLVPFDMWMAYGDDDLLARQFPSMVAWVEFARRTAAERRHPSRVEARPEPAPHEEHLWDAGFHWGEWCEPDVNGMSVFTGLDDQGHVATAYLARSAASLATMASVLGRGDDCDRYAALARNARAAWEAEFVDADGRVEPHTQANLTRALAFGLVDERHRARILDDLVSLVEEAGDHVGTGFLTTPFLLPTLADHGRIDVAYRLLLQTTPPSWLAMIALGANTIWENWEGIERSGTGSLNHYSKGAVVSFLHRHVAGIRLVEGEPAYHRFEIRPQPGGGLTWAEAELDSPYGRIRSAWTTDGDRFTLDVVVPPGTRATVLLPDGAGHEVDPGSYQFTSVGC